MTQVNDGRQSMPWQMGNDRGSHQRRWCCIMAGEMDVGGLDKVIPVLGLTIGMTLRVRAADGCWKFI